MLLLLALPLFLTNYYLHVLILILFFGLIATSWNILAGMAGQVSLGHALFVGVGAYTSTLLVIWFDLSPWIGMLAGGIAAMVAASCIGYLSFRCGLQGPYFALITFAFAQAFQILTVNVQTMGGASGLNVPLKGASFLAFQFESKITYYYVGLGLLSSALLTIGRIGHTRTGYYLKAIRENEAAAQALGIDPIKFKMAAALISAFFSAVGGSFYAQYVLFIDPQSILGMNLSLEIMIYAIVGGIGTVFGPLMGAAVLIPAGEFARNLFGHSKAGTHLIVYAIFLVWIILRAPRGIGGWIEDQLGRVSKETYAQTA